MMDELTFPRPDELTDEEWASLSAELEAYADLRYRQALEARTFKPHVVKHDVIEEEEPDQEDVPKKDRVKRKRDTVTDCPDCTKGLIAVDDALVCYDVVRAGIDTSTFKVTHHDIIACGRPR